MAAPLYTSNAIYAPSSRKMRVDPLSFILGGAVGALVYHVFRPKPVTAIVEITPKPKPQFTEANLISSRRPEADGAGGEL